MSHRTRRCARIFLFEKATGDLFLLRFAVDREDGLFTFWVTPGGEVEAGEANLAAATRELYEELGLTPVLHGPVHEETGGTYEHFGETVHNYDVFYAARCGREEPRWTGVTADEISLMREARWWTLAELRATSELIFPPQIAELADKAYKALAGGQFRPHKSEI